MADVTAKDDRSSDEIRRDIKRKRAEMDDTVDRIEDRLSPGQMLDELWSRVKSGGGGGLGDVVRDHPVPLALMGLGLGWLAVEQATGKSVSSGDAHPAGPGTWAPAEGRRGPYRGEAVHESSEGLTDKAKRKLRDAKESVSDAAADAKDRVTSDDDPDDQGTTYRDDEDGVVESGKSTARHVTAEATRQARHHARQAKRGFWSALEENPLALGAMAFGLGLASGVSAPTTEAEDRLMGRTSDTLKRETKRVAEDTAESAKAVAKDAAEAATEEARRQKEVKDHEGPARQLKEQAKDGAGSVAEAAKGAAKERAEREDLTGAGLKEEAAKAGARTKRAAKREADHKTS